MTTILVLTLLILLHELGHFLIAKLFGIRVEEFGFGIPPKALKLGVWRETEFTLNWLPIGGFVRLAGEDSSDPTLWEKVNPLIRNKMFWAKPAWQRALVILAGVMMNFVIGIVAFSIIYSHMGIPKENGSQVMVSTVVPNSPAALSDMEVGEVVTQVGEERITTSDQFVNLIKENKGQTVAIYLTKLDGNGELEESARVVSVVPRENPPEGEGALGVAVSTVPILKYEKMVWYKAPFYGAVEGTKEALAWSREFLRIFSHPAELLKNVGGPVAVVKVGQQAAEQGWIMMMRFAGIISLNLAIFNLLPIPALDGGRLLMVGLERIIGRKRVARVEGYVNGVGMILLISLLIGVTIKDLFFA